MEQWGSGNVTGTVGEFGQCICKVFLPDTTFPADRVDIVQITANKLTADLEVHINKVRSIQHFDVSLCFCNMMEKMAKLSFPLLR